MRLESARCICRQVRSCLTFQRRTERYRKDAFQEVRRLEQQLQTMLRCVLNFTIYIPNVGHCKRPGGPCSCDGLDSLDPGLLTFGAAV